MSDANATRTLVHIDLTVSDMERSLAFYTETLGFLVIEDSVLATEAAEFLSGGACRKMRMVFLTSGKTNSVMVELIQLVDGNGRRIPATAAGIHQVILAFRVSDLDEVARALAKQGQRPVSNVFDIPLPQLGRASCVFYRDPDGYLIEFVTFVDAA